MAINEIHVNDRTEFRVTIKDEDDNIVDLSSATSKQILFKKPDETVETKDASFYTDGTDGVLSYVADSGFLDSHGLWKMQGYIVIGGLPLNSDIYRFKVHQNITEG